MKVVNANNARERVVGQIREFLKEEDTGFIASNSFNFPIVEDGEEGWIEVVVKVVKDDEGYEKRSQYEDKNLAKAQKAKIDAEKKARKIERDEKARAERKLEREKLKTEVEEINLSAEPEIETGEEGQ